MNTIFISYNLNSQVEESTALRLQTISNLYGISVALPYRLANKSVVSAETIKRIENSSLVVAFCMDGISSLVKTELNQAILRNKPIVVLYDSNKGKKQHFNKSTGVQEIFVDFTKTDDALHAIADFLRQKLNTAKPAKTKAKQADETGLGIALLGIGLGLLAAWALSNNK